MWVSSYARFAEFQPIATIWLVSSVVADIGISVTLTVHLRRRRGAFARTNKLLDDIIRSEFAPLTG